MAGPARRFVAAGLVAYRRIPVAGLSLAFLVLAAGAEAQRFSTTRVSVSATGGQSTGVPALPDRATWPAAAAVSGDGRFVAFQTRATDLMTAGGDTNVLLDVYVKDRLTGAVTRISRGMGGQETNGDSYGPALSGDGRYVSFHSSASNLVPSDTNGVVDTFVHDRSTATTVRVSVASNGAQKVPYGGTFCTGQAVSCENGYIPLALSAGISATGRFVVFNSRAQNLVAGDTNPLVDIFVHDRDTDADGVFDEAGAISTTRVNLAYDGSQASIGNSLGFAITPDGRHVLFSSFAPNLVPGDTNEDPDDPFNEGLSMLDVFVRDRDTDRDGILDEPGAVATVRVSVSTAGVQTVTGGQNGAGAISANGRYVTFGSASAELLDGGLDTNGKRDVFVRDRDTDGDGIYDEPGAVATRRISVASDGTQGSGVDVIGASASDMSADGRFVSFTSESANLVAGDSNGLADIFLRDRDTDTDGLFDEAGAVSTTRVSVGSSGFEQDIVQGVDVSVRSSISSDGRVVVFWSAADNLVPGDSNGALDVFAHDRAAWSLTSLLATPTSQAVLSGNGRWLAFTFEGHVYVRDRTRADGASGATTAIDVTGAGAPGNGTGGAPDLSADGRFVVFRSSASDLVAGDTNGIDDVFVRDRDLDQDGLYDEPGQVRTFRASVATGNLQAVGGPSTEPRISPNGLYVVFASAATNLTPGAGVGPQIYLHDRITRVTTAISEFAGAKGNAAAAAPDVSDTGAVAFQTAASNLGTPDTNGTPDIYVSTPSGGARVMRLASGVFATTVAGTSSEPSMAADGALVAFTSTAALVAGDNNGLADIYVRRLADSGDTLRVSRATNGDEANGSSRQPAISRASGPSSAYQVVYTSAASTLVPFDANGVEDVFRSTFQYLPGPGGGYPFIFGETTRVSVKPDGSESPTASSSPVPSSDGLRVSILSKSVSTNLDITTGRAPEAVVHFIDPNEGPAAGNTEVILRGTGLEDYRVVPSFEDGGTSLPLTVDRRGADFIVARTPAYLGSAPRVFTIGVESASAGKSVALAVRFTYLPPSDPPCSTSATLQGPSTVGPAAGSVGTSVSDQQGCGWASAGDALWVRSTPASGTGDANPAIEFDANPSTVARSARLLLAGSEITLTQQGSVCSAGLSSYDRQASAGSNSGRVTAILPEGCPWTAVADPSAPWLTLTGLTSGTGSADVDYNVEPNPSGSPRVGTLTIGGRQHVVTQAGATLYTLNVQTPTGGQVQGPGINCSPDCTEPVAAGTTMTLTAVAGPGRVFDRWTDACQGVTGLQCTLTMTANRLVGVVFRLVEVRTLTVARLGNGTGTITGPSLVCPPGCVQQYELGSLVQLTALPATGSTFVGWTGDGCASSVAVTTVQMSADRMCTAHFSAPPGVTLTWAGSPVAGAPITLTAIGSGGTGPYSYTFWIHDGQRWTQPRQWNGSGQYTWTPALPGFYTVQAWMRDGSSTAAYDAWAVIGLNIGVPPTLTITAVTRSPEVMTAGTPVTWTATAAGGSAPHQFKWHVFDGTRWTIDESWRSVSTFVWTPPAAGTYTLQVWARNAGSAAALDAWRAEGPFTVAGPAALTVGGLTPNPVGPVPAGTPVTWTATAGGGTGPYTYRFWIFNGASWTLARDWHPSPSFTWIAPSAGTYAGQVWVRNAGSAADYDAWRGYAGFIVGGPAPLTVTSLTADAIGPPGSAVRVAAQARGGTGPYTFKLYVYNGASWSVIQDWSAANTWTWIPPGAGTYSLQVWVRNLGSGALYDAWGAAGPFVVTGAPLVPVTTLTLGPNTPVVVGHPTVFSASTLGGFGPYTYKFYVYDGISWSVGQDWSPANTWTWTPAQPGGHSVQVWMRNAGSAAAYDSWAGRSVTVMTPVLSSLPEIFPTPCPEESSQRSVTGTTPVTLTFFNTRTSAVHVHWIDYQGLRQPWFTLFTGQSQPMGSFLTHPWVVTNDTGQCLGVYLPSASAERVTIR